MPQLNLIENFPDFNLKLFNIDDDLEQGRLNIHLVNFPGSLSFKTVAVLLKPGPVATTGSLTLSFGLYSLNASTFSLANSASYSRTFNANATSWATFATSATQNITPGNWFFVMNYSSNMGAGVFGIYGKNFALLDGTYGGPFFAGEYSITTAGLPASIATSDCVKKGGTATNWGGRTPYILLTA